MNRHRPHLIHVLAEALGLPARLAAALRQAGADGGRGAGEQEAAGQAGRESAAGSARTAPTPAVEAAAALEPAAGAATQVPAPRGCRAYALVNCAAVWRSWMLSLDLAASLQYDPRGPAADAVPRVILQWGRQLVLAPNPSQGKPKPAAMAAVRTVLTEAKAVHLASERRGLGASGAGRSRRAAAAGALEPELRIALLRFLVAAVLCRPREALAACYKCDCPGATHGERDHNCPTRISVRYARRTPVARGEGGSADVASTLPSALPSVYRAVSKARMGSASLRNHWPLRQAGTLGFLDDQAAARPSPAPAALPGIGLTVAIALVALEGLEERELDGVAAVHGTVKAAWAAAGLDAEWLAAEALRPEWPFGDGEQLLELAEAGASERALLA
jgi:hypothetical protein